jgi:hypothetical protein
MNSSPSNDTDNQVTLQPVHRDNWRAVAKLEVAAEQREFVAEPCYYLALCAYDKIWQPLAVVLGEQVIGFLMLALPAWCSPYSSPCRIANQACAEQRRWGKWALPAWCPPSFDVWLIAAGKAGAESLSVIMPPP